MPSTCGRRWGELRGPKALLSVLAQATAGSRKKDLCRVPKTVNKPFGPGGHVA